MKCEHPQRRHGYDDHNPDQCGEGTTPINVVRAMAPLITSHADTIEQERRLPAEVVDALTDAGVFRLLVPHALGGGETDPFTACRIVEELSSIDGATGWCGMLGACLGHFAGLLPEEAAREIYLDPRAVVAGAFRPNGVASVVPGGYRLTGRWQLGSGINHAT